MELPSRFLAPLLCSILSLVDAQVFRTDYMSERCNEDLGERVAGRLESSESLTYANLMDCYLSVSVPSGQRIMLWFYRFDLEDKLDGQCVDFFNLHDGPSTGFSRLKPYPFCGTWSTTDGLTNMTTTSNHVTFYFQTDNTAVFRGFEIIYVGYTVAPCRDSQFACNNSLCIDPSLRCDEVTQCGDGSDELNCPEYEEEKEDSFPWGLVIGCTVAGLLLLFFLVVACYKAYDYYKWKGWLARHRFKRFPWQATEGAYEYPVTDRYSKYEEEIGPKGRREPDVSPYFRFGPEGMWVNDGERYLDEN